MTILTNAIDLIQALAIAYRQFILDSIEFLYTQVVAFHDFLFLSSMVASIISLIYLSSTYKTRFLVSTIACFSGAIFLATH